MNCVDFRKATLDGDGNYIVVVEVGRGSDELFHFTQPFDHCSAFQMCGLFADKEQQDKVRMMTGEVDDDMGNPKPAIVFEDMDSSECYVYYFTNKKDLDTASDLAARFWEILHRDEIADEDE